MEANRSGAEKRGLVIVYTGEGKGKTTAAMGMLMRAWGRGMRVSAIQFIKDTQHEYGESMAAKRMGFPIRQVGNGCTWQGRKLEDMRGFGLQGWAMAQEAIRSGESDVLLLDEFTYLMHFGWLKVEEVVDWLRQNRPADLTLVMTGRYAPQALMDYADLVTEMKEIKHPFATEGLLSQPGIDY
ncbi:MAG: cob(I)alamin adenosyltransferase [Chloroflexota bacterium]|nr:cob(I)alamin adenosyltransferase [Chloroflexota bacterium]